MRHKTNQMCNGDVFFFRLSFASSTFHIFKRFQLEKSNAQLSRTKYHTFHRHATQQHITELILFRCLLFGSYRFRNLCVCVCVSTWDYGVSPMISISLSLIPSPPVFIHASITPRPRQFTYVLRVSFAIVFAFTSRSRCQLIEIVKCKCRVVFPF